MGGRGIQKKKMGARRGEDEGRMGEDRGEQQRMKEVK